MNVLSLFDGLSAGRIALDRAGIKVDQYFASEIDPYAIQISQNNYPDIIRLGDVRGISDYLLPKIHLLMGGSPCQGFSDAGLGLGFKDPRSALFYEYVRILRELKAVNPDLKFLLENVSMKQAWQDIISEALGVKPIRINSAIFSAAKRDRFYWTNIPVDPLPADKGILLKDIIEYGYVDRDKALCITSSYYKGLHNGAGSYLNKSKRQLVFLSEEEIERAYRKHKGQTWHTGNRMGNMQFPNDINKKSKIIECNGNQRR